MASLEIQTAVRPNTHEYLRTIPANLDVPVAGVTDARSTSSFAGRDQNISVTSPTMNLPPNPFKRALADGHGHGGRGRDIPRSRRQPVASAASASAHDLRPPWGRRIAPLLRALFRGSSVVEQPAVNRLVVGSNPTRGASSTAFLYIFHIFRRNEGFTPQLSSQQCCPELLPARIGSLKAPAADIEPGVEVDVLRCRRTAVKGRRRWPGLFGTREQDCLPASGCAQKASGHSSRPEL